MTSPSREKAARAGRTCPSAPCEEGSILIGIVGRDNRVGYVNPPLPLNESFMEQVHSRSRTPQERFRFASPCTEGRCVQWTGDRCGVIELVLAQSSDVNTDAESLPPCGIRASCRWFEQEGRSACKVCPLVVTLVR
jgi:hypothetical protein